MGMPYVYTPLRYPGGKAKVAKFMKLVFKKNELMDGHYVEPYAGGAGVAMELLLLGFASHIHINDIDPGIHAFWYSVLFDTNKLCKQIYDAKLDIEEWEKQRKVQMELTDSESLDLGFSTFYLNRTNYSGVINGGPIGGYRQSSKWNMDARFNKIELIQRIERIAYFSNRIHLSNKDAICFIKTTVKTLPKQSLIYLDPPYFTKGSKLYRNFYKGKDHVDVCDIVKKLRRHWIVSYDNAPEINELYSEYRKLEYDLRYSVKESKTGSECMYFCHSLVVPEIENPTRVQI